jgi:hypothetical protein
LQNNDYLRNHFIKFSHFLKRDLVDRRAKTGSLPPLLTPDSIHSLNAASPSPAADDPQDFVPGRG